jgi:hypothetical protein
VSRWEKVRTKIKNLEVITMLIRRYIAIPIVVRYRVLGFEESGVRSQDSGVKILVYLMRLGNAIFGRKLPKTCVQ